MLRSINVLSSKEKEYSIGVNIENQCENLAFSEQKLVSINSFFSEKKKKVLVCKHDISDIRIK